MIDPLAPDALARLEALVYDDDARLSGAEWGCNVRRLQLAALDKQHKQRGPEYCFWCGEPWPCPTSTLIQVVRKQNEALKKLRSERVARAALNESAALVDPGEPT